MGTTMMTNNPEDLQFNHETELAIKQAEAGINLSKPYTNVDDLMRDLKDTSHRAILHILCKGVFTNDDFVDEMEVLGFYKISEIEMLHVSIIHYDEDATDDLIDRIKGIFETLQGFSTPWDTALHDHLDRTLKHIKGSVKSGKPFFGIGCTMSMLSPEVTFIPDQFVTEINV